MKYIMKDKDKVNHALWSLNVRKQRGSIYVIFAIMHSTLSEAWEIIKDHNIQEEVVNIKLWWKLGRKES